MKSSPSTAKFAKTQLLLLLSLFLTACSIPTWSHAQDKNPLTPKYLIGDAVSLSNQEYPEIDKAIQRFRNGDTAGAQEYLQQAKEKYPKLAPTDVMMAKMQLLNRNARLIQYYLERATINDPKDPEAYLILADRAFAALRTAESLALFSYATPLVKEFKGNEKRKRNFKIRVLAGRSAITERRQQWESAQKLLTQWLEIDPDNASAHSRMGFVLYRLNKQDEALAEFAEAYKINPAATHPLISLGQLSFASGQEEEARKYYEKAYKENKSNPEVAQAYAEWLIQIRNLDQAQQVTAALVKKQSDDVDSLLLDGIIAYMQKKPDRAEQTLQKVLSLDPRNERATDLMALLLIQSDDIQDKERALQYAQSNADKLPNNAQTNVTRAYVLYELGRKAEANQSLTKAGRMQIRPDATFLVAKILAAEGRTQQAIGALEKIVNNNLGLVIFREEAEALLAKLKTPAGSE